jgi:hypothetical protein
MSKSDTLIPVGAIAGGGLLLFCAVKNYSPVTVMKNIATGNWSDLGGAPPEGSPISPGGLNGKTKNRAYPGGPTLHTD